VVEPKNDGQVEAALSQLPGVAEEDDIRLEHRSFLPAGEAGEGAKGDFVNVGVVLDDGF
jgi:hypothetical protein